MLRVTVDPPWDLQAWRAQARRALAGSTAPECVSWDVYATSSLFGGDAALDPDYGRFEGDGATNAATAADGAVAVPQEFLSFAGALVMHRSQWRHALPYRILWRLVHGEPGLLQRSTDPDIHCAEAMRREVRRDLHKMKAFVRFRAIEDRPETYVAWFEPEHDILDAIAPFFARRFAGMRWSILTPYRSAHWDGDRLQFGEGAVRADAPRDDALETLWRRYYAHIFNPARLNVRMMRKEMPWKYWKNLPEAQLIPSLAREAGARSHEMVERKPGPPNRRTRAPKRPAAPKPVGNSLSALREAAEGCRNCELWKPATQLVFGEGPARARVLVVGEQPGDEEDLRGRPFVGPSGRLFDKAVEELGLDRRKMYVTNAVKHFRFELRGKFRLHRSPSARHVNACHMWLEGEMDRIKPDVVVCLGAIAAKAVFGASFALMRNRGEWQTLPNGRRGFATVHPSFVLRQRDSASREKAYRDFVADLALLLDEPS